MIHRLGRHCEICGLSLNPILHTHHIKPRSEGGKDNRDNLIVLCPNCHAIAHLQRKSPFGTGFDYNRVKTGLTKEQFDKLLEVANRLTWGKL